MKILMRADTHVSFSVPAEEPKAKCTNSQVSHKIHIKKLYPFFISRLTKAFRDSEERKKNVDY